MPALLLEITISLARKMHLSVRESLPVVESSNEIKMVPFPLHTSHHFHPRSNQSICSSPFISLLPPVGPRSPSHAASWMRGLIAGNLGIDVPSYCYAYTRSSQTNLTLRIQQVHNPPISSHGVHATQVADS